MSIDYQMGWGSAIYALLTRLRQQFVVAGKGTLVQEAKFKLLQQFIFGFVDSV